jgi:hypothetical protein
MTNETRDYSREELLEPGAARHLAQGYTDAQGKPMAELQTTFATATATQFFASQLAPQELTFTFEALRQVLPMYTDTPSAQIQGAVGEALETVRAMVNQPNNTRLVQWLGESSAAVKNETDVNAFLDHFMAVLRQYTVIAASASASASR